MSPIVLATYLVQAISSVITAVVLLRFWTVYRREYLQYWGLSWAALAAYQMLAGLGYYMAGTIVDASHPIRLTVSVAALAASGGHVAWLLQGTMAMVRKSGGARRHVHRNFAMCVIAIVLAAVLIVAISSPMDSGMRRLIRADAHALASAIAFAIVAFLLLFNTRPARGLGTRMLAIGAMAYAVAQFAYVGVSLYDIAAVADEPVAEYAGMFNRLVHVVISLGMVIWLLDDERARAEETAKALSESQQRLRRLVEDVRLIAWEFDPTTKQFTFVSPQAEEILGYSLVEWMQPEFWYNHVHPEDREGARAYSNERTLSGVDYEFEYRMLKRDGGVVWFRDLTSIIHRDGKPRILHGILIDITGQKAAEEQLAQSEERFRNLVQSSTDAIIVNQQGRVAFCNDAAVRMLGHESSKSLLGAATLDFIAPSSKAIVGERIRRLSTSSDPLPMIEERWVRADGREIEVEVGAAAIEFGGKPAIQVQGRDITPRKDAERAVTDIARRLKTVVDAAPVVLWATDTDLVFTLFEGRGLQAIGRRPGDAVGFRVAELYGDVAGAVENHRRALAGEVVVDVVDVNGVMFESRFAPVTASDGRVTGVIGVAVDVTQRMRTEAALRESEARMRAVIENTPNVAIQGYDLDGRVMFWSPAAARLFGWSEEEALGKRLDSLMLDADGAAEFVRVLREVHRTGTPTDPGEWRFTSKNGRKGWCYSTIFEIPSGGTPTFICMDVDITQRKETEQALERSNHLQRLLLSELDHRVRNNLASLTALIDISSRDSRSVKDFAASIRTRVQAMSVVHALLSREHWQAVDLRQLILTLAPVGAQQALRITGPAVAIVPRQATALGMVVQELLVNSQKYGALAHAESGGGHIDVRWTVDHEPRGDGEHTLRLRWREHGGRPISEPVRAGVGTGLVQGLVRTELRGEATLDFPREGASHEFTFVLDANEPEGNEFVAPVK